MAKANTGNHLERHGNKWRGKKKNWNGQARRHSEEKSIKVLDMYIEWTSTGYQSKLYVGLQKKEKKARQTSKKWNSQYWKTWRPSECHGKRPETSAGDRTIWRSCVCPMCCRHEDGLRSKGKDITGIIVFVFYLTCVCVCFCVKVFLHISCKSWTALYVERRYSEFEELHKQVVEFVYWNVFLSQRILFWTVECYGIGHEAELQHWFQWHFSELVFQF